MTYFKTIISYTKLGIILTLLLFPNCSRETEKSTISNNKSYTLFSKQAPKPKKIKIKKAPEHTEKPEHIEEEEKRKKEVTEELDFEVENRTGKTIYVTCFSYIQKVSFTRWRWDKSPIYKLEHGKSVVINIDTIPDKKHRKDIYGYLTIFDEEKEAHDAIYELVPDTKKIDLDRISTLKSENKKIVVTIERYGIKKGLVDFEVVDKDKKKERYPELDFTVENRTGKTIYVAGFVYEVEDNFRETWSFDKTPIIKLKPGESNVLDIDTIQERRDRRYMHGYLGIFEEHEEELAHDSTYELLDSKRRITLGRLSQLKNKKILIQVEQYGQIGEITEFAIQDLAHKKLYKPKYE